MWFFLSARYKSSGNYVAGMYYDKNFNNPNVWTFEPDTSRRAFNPTVWKGGQLRVAWQASAKNKIGISWNDIDARKYHVLYGYEHGRRLSLPPLKSAVSSSRSAWLSSTR